ncbi:MAG: class I SAM-dependent methyltransferase [Leptolyngbyaceae bacterium]|nr:class I SAM-dependent methyltransferase [Leptolyngbyaceae bacterium]
MGAEFQFKLERLENCPICGFEAEEKPDFILHDFFSDDLSANINWYASICRVCKSYFLNPRPTVDTVLHAYKDYYTHTVTSDAVIKHQSSIRKAIARHIRDTYVKCKLSHEVYLWDILIGTLAFLSPKRRLITDIGIRYAARFLSRPFKARVLDIGAGSGDYLNTLQKYGWQCYAVEPDMRCGVHSLLPSANIFPSIDSLGAELESAFDLITLSHTLEHLHDPVGAIKKCNFLLKTSGRIWIDIPNPNSSLASIFGEFWRGFEAPRHLILFEKNYLLGLLKALGFDNINCISRPDVFDFMERRSREIMNSTMSEMRKQEKSHKQLPNIRSKIEKIDRSSEFLTIVAEKSFNYLVSCKDKPIR